MHSRGVSPIIAEVFLVAIAITAAVGAYVYISSTLSATTSSVSTTASSVVIIPPHIDSAQYNYETNTLRLYVRTEENLDNVSIYVKSSGRVVAFTTDVDIVSCSGGICVVEANLSLPASCDNCHVFLYSSSGAPSSAPLSISNAPVLSGTSSSSTGGSGSSTSGSTADFSAFAAWDYNKIISIDYNGTNTLTDYQIRIELNSSNFNFALANPEGNDIRFADINGTELNYWIQEWNADTNTAIIWVKVPRIDPPETNIIMFYGNPSATSESDGYRTFLFFDDFDSNTGIWDYNAVIPSGGSASWTISNGYLVLSASGTGTAGSWTQLWVYTKNPVVIPAEYNRSLVFGVYSYVPATTDNYYTEIFLSSYDENTPYQPGKYMYVEYAHRYSLSPSILYQDLNGTLHTIGYALQKGGFSEYLSYTYFDSGTGSWVIEMYQDNNYVGSYSQVTPLFRDDNFAISFNIHLDLPTVTYSYEVDWVFIGLFARPSPVVRVL